LEETVMHFKLYTFENVSQFPPINNGK